MYQKISLSKLYQPKKQILIHQINYFDISLHKIHHFSIVLHLLNMENIYSAVKPFYILAKFLGLFPKSFKGSVAKGILKTKWHDVIISTISLSVLIFLIYRISSEKTILKIESKILMRAWDISLVMGLYFLLIQFVYQCFEKNEISEFLRHLHKFDNKVC